MEFFLLPHKNEINHPHWPKVPLPHLHFNPVPLHLWLPLCHNNNVYNCDFTIQVLQLWFYHTNALIFLRDCADDTIWNRFCRGGVTFLACVLVQHFISQKLKRVWPNQKLSSSWSSHHFPEPPSGCDTRMSS